MKTPNTVTLDYRQLRAIACGYIVLPLLVFFCGFLKWYFALAGVAALCLGVLSVLRGKNVEQSHKHVSNFKLTTILGIFAFNMVWTQLGGLNGLFYQSSDWNIRNAIFYDLIQFEWPVVYENTGAALVYYIGHWLPPAIFGKLTLLVTGSMPWAWRVGRVFFWGWTSLGLTIVIMLILHYLKASTKKARLLAIAVFVCFSGLDILAALYYKNLKELLNPNLLHMEWWSAKYQFTGITACVYWVFNQTVIPWIITLCVLMDESPRNYVLYCVACLLCGPLPCVGIAICMAAKAVEYCIRQIRAHRWKTVLRDIFSFGNFVVLLGVFPLVAAYILANNAVGGTDTAGAAAAAATQPSFFSSGYWNRELLIFLAFEVGFYMLLVFNDRKKDLMFYVIGFIFVIAPYFRIGASNDFCMRVSVPGMFILMLYAADYLLKHLRFKKADKITLSVVAKRICALVLAVLLCFGAVSPAVEVYRGFYHVIKERSVHLANMTIGSFENEPVYLNFHCTEPENQFFFKYLSK